MMSERTLVTIIGWFVTFFLGIISTLIIQRMFSKKKIIGWSVMNEVEWIPKIISESLEIPIKILVEDSENESLSSVQVKVGNVGNEEIDTFNTDAKIISHAITNDLGAYNDNVLFTKTNDSKCKLSLDFINCRKFIDLEFLIGNYALESISLDFASKGVSLKKTETSKLMEMLLSEAPIKAFGFGLLGVKYDPSASALFEIAQELKKISNKINR